MLIYLSRWHAHLVETDLFLLLVPLLLLPLPLGRLLLLAIGLKVAELVARRAGQVTRVVGVVDVPALVVPLAVFTVGVRPARP